MLSSVIKLQLRRKKKVHLALLGKLHNASTYLFSSFFDLVYVLSLIWVPKEGFFWQRFSPRSDVCILGKRSIHCVISSPPPPNTEHKSDCDAAVLSRELYNGFGPGLWCGKLRSMRSCVKERAAVTQSNRHSVTELW